MSDKNKEIVSILNKLMGEELNAICQYTVHANICEDWGYCKLADKLSKTARAEMGHLDGLIERILFLEDIPKLTLGEVAIGKDVKEIIKLSVKSEEKAVEDYNDAIDQVHGMSDQGTNHIIKKYCETEEKHLEQWRQALQQIEDMGLETYLAQQVNHD